MIDKPENCWRASGASETVLGVDSAKSGICYWRQSVASIASVTLTGVTQTKIGDVCVFICMDVRVSFCTLTTACQSLFY